MRRRDLINLRAVELRRMCDDQGIVQEGSDNKDALIALLLSDAPSKTRLTPSPEVGSWTKRILKRWSS